MEIAPEKISNHGIDFITAVFYAMNLLFTEESRVPPFFSSSFVCIK